MSLKLVLLSAAGLKDADLIGKSDPYVVFKIDNQKQQSRTIRDTLNPVWNPPDVIIFNHIPNSMIPHRLHISVMDRDTITSDDKIGHGTIDFRHLPPMVETPMQVSLGRHGFFKKATLNLRITYSPTPNAFVAGGPAPMAYPPAGGFPAQPPVSSGSFGSSGFAGPLVGAGVGALAGGLIGHLVTQNSSSSHPVYPPSSYPPPQGGQYPPPHGGQAYPPPSKDGPYGSYPPPPPQQYGGGQPAYVVPGAQQPSYPPQSYPPQSYPPQSYPPAPAPYPGQSYPPPPASSGSFGHYPPAPSGGHYPPPPPAAPVYGGGAGGGGDKRARAMQAFQSMDRDHSGSIDVNEFVQAMNQLGVRLSYEDARCVFSIVDSNRSGKITRDEFLDYYLANYSR